MRVTPHILGILSVAMVVALPLWADASELRLETNKINLTEGEEFIVEVVLQADLPVNAVEGLIRFQRDLLAIREIRDGNSTLNFWIERPQETSPGTLSFSGMTPGGLAGVRNSMFTVVFEAIAQGAPHISLSNARALQNDGLGTEAPLQLRGASVRIQEGDSNARQEIRRDAVPPEPFTPMIAQAPLAEGNRFFVAFSTQDKGSGIASYAVREYRFNPFRFIVPWRSSEAPHVLADQGLKSYVAIRAIDMEGNVRSAVLAPQHPLAWYEYAPYWLILLGAGLLFLWVCWKLVKKFF